MEPIEPIENKLNQAMKRVEPPDGFAARVMARVETQTPAMSKPLTKPHSSWFTWWRYLIAHPVPAAAIVFTLLLVLAGVLAQGRRQALSATAEQERIEGQKARAQLLLALEITGAQLSRMHALLSQPPPNGPTPGDKGVHPLFSH